MATTTAFPAWTFSYYAAFSSDARSCERIFWSVEITANETKLPVAGRNKIEVTVKHLNGQMLNSARGIAAICYMQKFFLLAPDSGPNDSDFIAV